VSTIRRELHEDVSQVRTVNELAFGRPTEADLVDRLRKTCPEALSLVADDGIVVGHILFTPVVVESPRHTVVGMGLAPLAVLPDHQRQGIGTRLVERGLALLRERGCAFVVVVGDVRYYGRFGFAPAAECGLACPWEGVPAEAFMATIMDARAMDRVAGVARYRVEFDEAIKACN
jgi:putative acetyltransferase